MVFYVEKLLKNAPENVNLTKTITVTNQNMSGHEKQQKWTTKFLWNARTYA